MIGLVMLAAAWTAQPNQTVTSWGAGRETCAAAWQPSYAAISRSWVLGYWTGLNLGTAQNVASGGGADQIIGAVQWQCRLDPSLDLLSASYRAFIRLEQGN